jgi:2-hydroxy-6-oxonona-2,4-dienedioate hydrolase
VRAATSLRRGTAGGLGYRAAPLPGGAQVVLVHGLGVSSSYFVPLLRKLAGRAGAVAPDLPGFGSTPGPPDALGIEELADTLVRFVEALELERPLLLGNSLGCQIVVDVAVRRPDLVGALALVGPTVDPAAPRLAPQAARLLIDGFREHPLAVPGMLADYLRVGPRRIVATARAALRDRIEDKLPLVAVPSIVIHGSRDPLSPARWCEHAARLLPEGRLITIDGAAHAAHWSHPAETVAALEPLLARLRPGMSTPRR